MLILLPTDTCYGLAGEMNEQDYLEIYRLKGRDFSKPLALLVEDYDDLEKYIEISDVEKEFIKKYPHPWSFLGKRRSDCILPVWMESEKYQMLSIRVARVCLPKISSSHHPVIPSFPLFLTSANLAGAPESKTLAEARAIFPGIEGIEGGVCDRPPSDIFSIGEEGELQYLRRNYL